jgi:restriction system protein
MTDISLPTYDAMMNPAIEALRRLGGSGTIAEINEQVFLILGLTDEQLEVLHDPERGAASEVEYRLHWTRTYLKKYGILENSSRGVWALTPLGQSTERVDEKIVRRFVLEQMRATASESEPDQSSETDIIASWRDQIMSAMLHMEPSAFERLFQRVLRESGFIQVEVTGSTGDGGIDGVGIMRLGGLLSFHVMFQCKRWQGSIGASIVRDFRGAMVGRADKGLIVTTGTFTKDALREATRDGAPAIDLIDGEALVDKLKELSLGVKTEIVQVENVTVDEDWFLGI